MNWTMLREGQREAIRVTVERFIANEEYTAIILPTRYGKSDAMRLIAIQLWQDGHMGCALALSPNVVLRDQLVANDKWLEMYKRYDVKSDNIKRRLEYPVADPTVNGEMFLSATMQLVSRNIDVFCQFVGSVYHRTHKRVLVLIDECHTGSEDNSWGDTVKELVDAGARAALFTATALRSDGKRIPGFDFEVSNESTMTATIVRPGSEPHLVQVDIYQGLKHTLKLKAHHETTFQSAWDMGALCKIGRIPFDVDLSRLESGQKMPGELLSDLSGTEVRRALSVAVRSPMVVQEGVRRLVDQLGLYHSGRISDAAGIVFCGNDDDKVDPSVNKHAAAIKKEIKLLAPDLSVVIATSAEGEGRDELARFQGGRGDVLIVKQMASLGLDIPRLKVGLDLSPVRAYGANVQRMMRIGTPYKSVTHAVWICPDDILSRALFENLVTNSGGEARSSELELVRSYEKEREAEGESTVFGVEETQSADFEDSAMNFATKDRFSVVEAILTTFPSLTQSFSHAEIATQIALRGLTFSFEKKADEDVVARDTGLEIDVLRSEINDVADEVVNQRQRFGGYDPEEYPEIRRQIFIDAYRVATVPKGTHLSQIADIRKLRAILAALQYVLVAFGES